jgi:hypothetical protein
MGLCKPVHALHLGREVLAMNTHHSPSDCFGARKIEKPP